MERFEEPLSIPFIVFPAAAAFAIVVAWILHQVPRFYAPVAALVMVLVIMGLGFLLSARADDPA
jgi:hypothetical protein